MLQQSERCKVVPKPLLWLAAGRQSREVFCLLGTSAKEFSLSPGVLRGSQGKPRVILG